MSDYQRFLVPYDDSSHARSALAMAVDLASRLGGEVTLLHVVQPPPAFGYSVVPPGGVAAAIPPGYEPEKVREQALASLEAVAREHSSQGAEVSAHVVEGVSIANSICDSARELGADMLVMGTHGRTGLAHVFLGSVTERTLRSAPVPVLTVRCDDEDEDA